MNVKLRRYLEHYKNEKHSSFVYDKGLCKGLRFFLNLLGVFKKVFTFTMPVNSTINKAKLTCLLVCMLLSVPQENFQSD